VGGDPANGSDPSGLYSDTPGQPGSPGFASGFNPACQEAFDFFNGLGSSNGIPTPFFFDPLMPSPCFGGVQPYLPFPWGGGMGGGGSLKLSKTCLNALSADKKNAGAVIRAYAAEATLETAVKGTDISWTMLAAIGIRESGFLEGSENDGAGLGVGVFQITVKNPFPTANGSGVSYAQASNLTWAANWSAQTLNSNMAYLANKFSNFTPSQLLQATAASFNLNPYKPGNFTSNPSTIDAKTALGNYGSNVIQLMSCF
jgi:hypothetical protein